MHSLFIFRRDLRIEDNTALNQALKHSEKVTCVFIFLPEQKNHSYFSEAGFQFMSHSLAELEEAFKSHKARLNFCVGSVTDVLNQTLKDLDFKALYLNKDYTPFAQQRDQKIEQWCTENKINFNALDDATLNAPEETTKEDGTPYKVFTPYYRNALQIKVKEPFTEKLEKLSDQALKNSKPLEDIVYSIQPGKNDKLHLKGGRKEALNIYQHLNKNYDDQRDYPIADGTTHLSAHHKFGTVSMRGSYYQLGQFYGFAHTVISELYWHDFFTHVGYFYPHVFKKSFTPKFENLTWENDAEKFKAWCEGRTGFPIVDAGMRELNTTGYMHNRVRMITASFLIKNLAIDWHWGEKYFAQKLTDYDPAINNGNWQWAASTGVDAQPFFRIFNPWRQQERFDNEAEYIKKWIPELSEISAKEINKWEEAGPNLLTQYPQAIVEHKTTSEKTKLKYKTAHEKAKS
jgi:deoxyribodipyrimidine photo-lyase